MAEFPERYRKALLQARFPPATVPDPHYPINDLAYETPPLDPYWAGVRQAVFAHYGPKSHLAQARWAEVKRRRYKAQQKEWGERMPELVRAWAEAVIRSELSSGTFECVDNVWVSDARSSSKRAFARNRERGCCGRHEWEAKGPDGQVYRFGFNYGH